MNNNMSDEQRSAAQEAVPAALHYMHQRLLEDGAVWRNELPFSATRSSQAFHETTATPQPQYPANARNGYTPVMTPLPTLPRRDVSWARRVVASAAIIVVVGLLAALFATFARGRNEPRVAASPTAGPVASWFVVPQLTDQPVPPMISPSDPSVVYEAGSRGANFAYVLRRSDDAGAIWRNLAQPLCPR